jgi:hypothetical protein
VSDLAKPQPFAAIFVCFPRAGSSHPSLDVYPVARRGGGVYPDSTKTDFITNARNIDEFKKKKKKKKKKNLPQAR